MSERCADLSFEAGEALGATAVTATRWLLVEVPGTWPRDVAEDGALVSEAREVVSAWLRDTPGSRLHFIRRPGRTGARLVVYAVLAEEDAAEIRRIELRDHADLAALELESAGEVVDGSLVLVCGHGTRDRCCALRGTTVFVALSARLGEEEVWISSHQGGHRFAANVLVLPAALQFGRVEPDEAPYLVARALGGRIELDRYRGRTCYAPTVQAAEIAIRRAARADGVDEIRLEREDANIVTFTTWNGGRYSALVEKSEGPSVPPSCGAEPAPQRALHARLV